MGFPRQEYWSGLPFPSPGDLPDAGIKPMCPALAGGSLPHSHQGSPERHRRHLNEYYWVKEVNIKRLYTKVISLQLIKINEKKKAIYCIIPTMWLCKRWNLGESKNTTGCHGLVNGECWMVESKGFLGQWNYSVYYNDECMDVITLLSKPIGCTT